jgi:hypothetical protein
MNKILLVLLCGCALCPENLAIAADSAPQSGEVAEEAATNACFQAFLHELFPGSNVRVRTVNRAQNRVFDDEAIIDEMSVHMVARSGGGNQELANGDCIVNRSAHVISLYTRKLEPQRLAALTVHDIQVASN